MSRIGFHVKTGPRNGYGLVCEAKPAIIFSVGEGGALTEAEEKSAGHTWTMYRDITYYGDNPNINNMTVDEAEATAEILYPKLRAEWVKNPADYYAVLNETGANDERVIEVANAYERRMMELAEPDGFLLVVCNLFSGTPDDGSAAGGSPNGGMEMWKRLYGEHIGRAFAAGHVYGRHCYGFPDLLPLDFNSDRPFREAEWLASQGLYGGIAITELGLNGGMSLPPEGHMMSQLAQYDALLRGTETARKFFIGGAWWTYGDWHDANIQSSSAELATYLEANPSPAWEPPDKTEPPPEGQTLMEFLWDETVAEQETCGIRLNDEAGLEQAIRERGLIPVISEISRTFPGESTGQTVQAGEDLEHLKPREVFVYQPGQPIWSFTDPHVGQPPGKLVLEYFPTDYQVFTQAFGVNRQNYDMYCDADGVCLQGHNGLDIMAPLGTPFYAPVGGTVVWASDQRPSGGPSDYGWHIRIVNGHYTIILAHAAPELLVRVGDVVVPGQVVALSGNTGRSTGPHLHFEMRLCPGLPGWPWCIIDPTPYIQPLLEQKPPIGIDMKPYFQVVQSGYGPFFVLQHASGITEDIQTQVVDGQVWLNKGHSGQYEHIRVTESHVERAEDTSHSASTLYTLDDGYGWSKWAPRFWRVGDAFYREPLVTIMTHECQILSQVIQGSWLVFDAFHPTWVSPESNASPNGIEFNDVIELSFRHRPDGTKLEIYKLAPNLGPYVEWMNDGGLHSWVSEIPLGRPPLVSNIIDCL